MEPNKQTAFRLFI